MGTKISALTTASALTGSEYLAIVQGGSTVKVALSALATFLGGSVTPTPSVALSSPSVAEGNSGTTNLAFTATLTRNGITGAIPFTWAVTGGTAIAADYVGGALPSGSGTFASGASTATINVPVQGDTTVEPDETCIVTITLGSPYGSVTANSTGTITNDDTAGPTLPQTASLVAKFRARDIPVQTDNTPLTSWSSSVGAAVATAATKPAYRTSAKSGLPGVQFSAGGQLMTLSSETAVRAALDSATSTRMYVVSGISGGDDLNAPFAAFNESQQGFIDKCSPSGGIGTYSDRALPYTAELDDFMVLVITSTTSAAAGLPNLGRTFINGGLAAANGNATGQTVGNPVTIGWVGFGAYNTRMVVHDIYIWNRELTNAEVKQATKLAFTEYAKALPWAGMNSYPLFAGDSKTQGYGQVGYTGNYPYQVCMGAGGLGLKYGQWDNVGRGSASYDDLPNVAAGDIDNVAAALGINTSMAFDEQYNSRGDAAITTKSSNYLLARIAAGMSASRISFATAEDYTGSGVEKTNYTAYWDTSANRTGKMGQYVQTHLDTHIGVNGAAATDNGATYFVPGDLVHMQNAGYAIKAALVKPKIALAMAA